MERKPISKIQIDFPKDNNFDNSNERPTTTIKAPIIICRKLHFLDGPLHLSKEISSFSQTHKLSLPQFLNKKNRQPQNNTRSPSIVSLQHGSIDSIEKLMQYITPLKSKRLTGTISPGCFLRKKDSSTSPNSLKASHINIEVQLPMYRSSSNEFSPNKSLKIIKYRHKMGTMDNAPLQILGNSYRLRTENTAPMTQESKRIRIYAPNEGSKRIPHSIQLKSDYYSHNFMISSVGLSDRHLNIRKKLQLSSLWRAK